MCFKSEKHPEPASNAGAPLPSRSLLQRPRVYPQRYHPPESPVNDRRVTGEGSFDEAGVSAGSGRLGKEREIGVRSGPSRQDAASVDRFALRDELREVTRLKSVRLCGCVALKGPDGKPGVVALDRVRYPDGRHEAAFRGLQTCGSPWACPVCGAKIREGKARELSGLLLAHRAAGGEALSMLLTLTHRREEALSAVLTRFRAAKKALTSGRPWRALCERWGVSGWVLAPDFTHGVNGWHVHAHGVILTARALSAGEREDFEEALFVLWRAACERVGAARPLRRFNGLELLASDAAASLYAVKALREVTRTDAKHAHGLADRAHGRSPWELVRAFFRDGDTADLALWREYEAATKGLTAVSFSKSARELMATHGIREAHEDELAAARLEAETVDTLTLPGPDLETLRAVPGRMGVLRLFMRSGGAVAALDALVHWRLADEAAGRPVRRAGPPPGRSPSRSG